MDRRAARGRSLRDLMIFPMTGLVRLFGLFRTTVKRLTRAIHMFGTLWPLVTFCGRTMVGVNIPADQITTGADCFLTLQSIAA